MLRSTTERACRREPCPQHQTRPMAWPSAHPGKEMPNGVQSQAYQLLPKDSAYHPLYPPMNSIVRSFRAVQKPPWLHFIKHLLKMQLGKHKVKDHQREEPPQKTFLHGAHENAKWSPRHWALWNTLEFTGSYFVPTEQTPRESPCSAHIFATISILRPALCITTGKHWHCLLPDPSVRNWEPSATSSTWHLMHNHWGTACISSLTYTN